LIIFIQRGELMLTPPILPKRMQNIAN